MLCILVAAVSAFAPSRLGADPVKPEYRVSREAGIVVEMEGQARYRRLSSAVYRPLRLGSKVYPGDTLFVSQGSRVLLEETIQGSFRMVSIPSLSIYHVGARDDDSDLNVRTLIPNTSDVEERIANLKESAINKARSPLSRFDLRTLGSFLNESVLGLEGASVDESFRYDRMTTLSVLDLHPLTILSPPGDVHMVARSGLAPEVNLRFSGSRGARLLLSIWREAPQLQAVGSAYLAAGQSSLSWQPPGTGSYALQLLSLEGALKSRVVRVYVVEERTKRALLPQRVRPGDTVLLSY